MCGIAGRFNFVSGAPVDEAVVQGMCDLLAHRGPDGSGVHVCGPLGLGHRRLAIIDLSEAGRQPMSTADGRLTITFNGEIYNFADLRAEFARRGWRFRSKTDTEVILAAYSFDGPACLDRLRGMFAFAIWDAHTRTLFAARDRVGKKPLYYRVDGDGIAFASEPKAFLAEPGFEPRPDRSAIAEYLTYQYVPSPLSAFAGVQRLAPAHYLMVQDGRVSTHRYWRLSYARKRRLSEEDACGELVWRLKEATKLRLVSDVPLGAFLSGGLDSSTIVALMTELTGRPVKTFSIGFEHEEYDELRYARLVANQYASDHHEFVVRPSATEIFDRLVWHYNEPFADASAIPTYYLAQLTRQHVTVALNGDAGDENFAGYTRYLPDARVARYRRLPTSIRTSLEAVLRRLPASRRSDAAAARATRLVERASASRELRYALGMMHFTPSVKAFVFSDEFRRAASHADAGSMLIAAFAETDAPDFLDAMLDADVRWYLPDDLLVKVDIATMAHGLEGRSPLLDHELMEFAASLPSDMKLRGGVTKYIFKKAVRHLLPADIIDRPKKGFSVPLDHWFRHELREMAHDVLLSPRSLTRGYFRPEGVARLLEEHVTGVRDWHDQLWNLLMLELWHRAFIDARPRPAAPAAVAQAAGGAVLAERVPAR